MQLTHLSLWGAIGYLIVVLLNFKFQIIIYSWEYLLLFLYLVNIYPFSFSGFISHNLLQLIIMGISLGIFLGFLSYVLESVFLGNPLKQIANNFYFSLKYYLKRLLHFLIFFYQAILEELIWRGFIQKIIFQNSVFGLVITAAFFTLRHRDTIPKHFKNYLIFVLFSLALGTAYKLFDNLLLVIVFHATRNLMAYSFIYYKKLHGRKVT